MKSDLATRFERMSNQDILLVCGELTAGELRAVKAVLLWVSGQVRSAETDARTPEGKAQIDLQNPHEP